MLSLKMKGCALMLLLVIAGCASRGAVVPVAASCPIPPAPPAWMMAEPSNSLELLDELFLISEPGSSKTGQP
ncbi:MAG: Lipoprotein [Pseudomonas lundensis]